jgi:hypothetical protein
VSSRLRKRAEELLHVQLRMVGDLDCDLNRAHGDVSIYCREARWILNDYKRANSLAEGQLVCVKGRWINLGASRIDPSGLPSQSVPSRLGFHHDPCFAHIVGRK